MPIQTQTTQEDRAWFFALPGDLFAGVDQQTLTIVAHLLGGDPLPDWVTFDPVRRIFSGTPPPDFNGDIAFELVGTDGTTTATEPFTLSILAVDDPPVLAPNVLYAQNFDIDGSGFINIVDPNGAQTPNLHVVNTDGNGYIVSEGPWWVDQNHAPPGGGYLHLLATHYVNSDPAFTEFTGIDVDFDIDASDLDLPAGAQLYLWFQSVDPNIPWATGDYVNYVNIANPILPMVGADGVGHVHIHFSATDLDWLALGSSIDREDTYSKSANIAAALAGLPQDFGLIMLLGDSIPAQPASGTVALDNFVVTRPGEIRTAIASGAPGVLQGLNLNVDLSDVDNSNFLGSVLTLTETDSLTPGAMSLVASFENGIIIDGGVVSIAGLPVALLAGGSGVPLSITITAPLTDAEVEFIISNLAFASADGIAGQTNQLHLELTDVTGADTSLDIIVRVRAPLPDGEGVDIADGTDQSEGLRGGGGNDILHALGGNDRLDGGTGADMLYGGTGDDNYLIDNAGDQVFEVVGEGSDRIFAGVSYTLNAGAEVELMTTDFNIGTNAINLTGNELANGIFGNDGANTLSGAAGNDVLIGRAGNDILIGGTGADTTMGDAGDDWHFVDNVSDVVVELAGEGNDRVSASVSYAIAAGASVELLTTDLDTGTGAIDLTGNELANTIRGNDGVNTLTGAAGNDILVGRAGNDILVGGTGADTSDGGTGDDWHFVDNGSDIVVEAAGEGSDRVFASVSYALAAGAEVELMSTDFNTGTNAIDLTGNELANTIFGNDGVNTLTGLAGNDVLTGGGGNDILIGSTGVDTTNGGAGDDWHFVDNAGDIVVEAAGEGNDRIFASVSYALAAGVAVELMTTDLDAGTNAIDLTGNDLANGIQGNDGVNTLTGLAGNDVLTGRAGNDILVGGIGTDTMNGGTGDDWFFLDNAGDIVVELAGEGNDRLFTSVSYVLAAGVEVEELTTDFDAGTGAIDLTGNEIANSIFGNDGINTLTGGAGDDILVGRAGNDVLVGGIGADTTNGGTGNDWHFVDNADDVVVEAAGEGSNDRVFASVSYTLTAGAEVELMTTNLNNGTNAIDLTGNELANTIYGNDGVNALTGQGGNDILVGRGGNDILTGGTGVDTTYGDGGNDWHFVDNAGDIVVEHAGEGSDRVFASVSYALAAGVEVELMSTDLNTGTNAINLTGNEFANSIFGNDGVNTLTGGGGNDSLVGRAGNDILIGGIGADTTNGGAGDDWHYVDNAADVVMELAGEGSDRVFTSVSFTLGAGVEVEMMTTDNNFGTGAINLTGNEFANTIYGNEGVNAVLGGGGNDILIGRGGNDSLNGGTGVDATNGGAGNDFHYVDNAGDVVVELAGEGSDRVFASVSYTLAAGTEVEMMTTDLNTGTSAINLAGNEIANTIYGNNGANLIDGKGGNDTLIGSGGADTFAFTTALGPNNVDNLGDFTHGTDKIGLDDAIFTGIGGLGALNPNAFFQGTAAHDADDRIIFDQVTGRILFDADGNGAGAAVLFATVYSGTTLTASDFSVI